MDHVLADTREIFSRFEDETWLVWGGVLLPTLEEHVKQRKECEELEKRLAELDDQELMWNRCEETRQSAEGPLVDQLASATGEDADQVSRKLESLESEREMDIAEAEQDSATRRVLTTTPAADKTVDVPVEDHSVLDSKGKGMLVMANETFVDDNNGKVEIDKLVDEDFIPYSSQATVRMAHPQGSPMSPCEKSVVRVRTTSTRVALPSTDSELHVPDFPMHIFLSYLFYMFSDLYSV
jgi:hypothetical protein